MAGTAPSSSSLMGTGDYIPRYSHCMYPIKVIHTDYNTQILAGLFWRFKVGEEFEFRVGMMDNDVRERGNLL